MSLLFRIEGNPFKKVCKGKTLSREPLTKSKKESFRNTKTDERNCFYFREEGVFTTDQLSRQNSSVNSVKKEIWPTLGAVSTCQSAFDISRKLSGQRFPPDVETDRTFAGEMHHFSNTTFANCEIKQQKGRTDPVSGHYANQSLEAAETIGCMEAFERPTQCFRAKDMPIYSSSSQPQKPAPPGLTIRQIQRHYTDLLQGAVGSCLDRLPPIGTPRCSPENDLRNRSNLSPCKRTLKPSDQRNAVNEIVGPWGQPGFLAIRSRDTLFKGKSESNIAPLSISRLHTKSAGDVNDTAMFSERATPPIAPQARKLINCNSRSVCAEWSPSESQPTPKQSINEIHIYLPHHRM